MRLKRYFGGFLLLVLLTAALASFFIDTPLKTVTSQRLQAAGKDFFLGTDQLGRDLFKMLLLGSRTSLVIALSSVILGAILGSFLGLLTINCKNFWGEQLLRRAAQLIFAFPALFTAMILNVLLGPRMGNVIIAIALFNVPVFMLFSRSAGRVIWQQHFIKAAEAIGRKKKEILRYHVLPHLLPLLLVQSATQFSFAILAEAGLSYLGLGSQPPSVSWGRMLADSQTFAFQEPSLLIIPSLAICCSVLACDLFFGNESIEVFPEKLSEHTASSFETLKNG